MRHIIVHIVLLLIMGSRSLAQPGYEILQDVKKIDIPFEYENNLIIVKVMFNRIFPLRFIFDTGAEHTILSKRQYADWMGIPYEREFKLLGSDLSVDLKAYLIRGIHLKVENMIVPNHSLLVLGDDYFKFDEMTGVDVDGILGADIFRGLSVKINYEKKVITLVKYRHFTPPGGKYIGIPIDIKKNKPYLETRIQIQPDSVIDVRLLLDTGAMLSLLLNTDSDPRLRPPPNYIKGNVGAGLGGFIEGYIGRVASLHLGDLQCNGVITNFQELVEGADPAILLSRHGVIGNEILSRFHVVIDYQGQMLYLQPNRRFRESFDFDKSGLIVIASGTNLNRFIVHTVLPNTPAYEAGLLPGDEIRNLNFTPPGFLTLRSINATLRAREGKKITIKVRRGDEDVKVRFRLRKLI